MKALIQLSTIFALCSFQAVCTYGLSEIESEIEKKATQNTTFDLSKMTNNIADLLKTFPFTESTPAARSFSVEKSPIANSSKRLASHQVGIRTSSVASNNFTKSIKFAITTATLSTNEPITRTETSFEVIQMPIFILHISKLFVVPLPFVVDYFHNLWVKCLLMILFASYFLFGYGIPEYLGFSRKQLSASLLQDLFDFFCIFSFISSENLPIFGWKKGKFYSLWYVWTFISGAKIISLYYMIFTKRYDFSALRFPLDFNYLGSLLCFMVINVHKDKNPCSPRGCIHTLINITMLLSLAILFFSTPLATWDRWFFLCTVIYNSAHFVYRIYGEKIVLWCKSPVNPPSDPFSGVQYTVTYAQKDDADSITFE